MTFLESPRMSQSREADTKLDNKANTCGLQQNSEKKGWEGRARGGSWRPTKFANESEGGIRSERAHLKNASSNLHTCCLCQNFLSISLESSQAPLESPRHSCTTTTGDLKEWIRKEMIWRVTTVQSWNEGPLLKLELATLFPATNSLIKLDFVPSLFVGLCHFPTQK